MIVTVERIDRNKVRLGVTAPRGVAVDRSEIAAKKAAINLPLLPPEYGGEA